MREPTRTLLAAAVVAGLLLIMIPVALPGEASPVRPMAGPSVHAPIRIDGPGELDSVHGVSAGTGSAAHPYVLENMDINGSTEGYCLLLLNINSHIVVRNCTFHHAGNNFTSEHRNASVQLHNVTRVTFENTTFLDSYYGFYSELSDGAVLRNCTFRTAGSEELHVQRDTLLVNCSFHRDSLHVDPGSHIVATYYHKLSVVDAATLHDRESGTCLFGGVANATVRVYANGSSVQVFDGVSDDNGLIRELELQAFSFDGSGFNMSMSPMSIHGSAAGYTDGVNTTNVSGGPVPLELFLEDPFPPGVSALSVTPSTNISASCPAHISATLQDDNLIGGGIIMGFLLNSSGSESNYSLLYRRDSLEGELELTPGPGNTSYLDTYMDCVSSRVGTIGDQSSRTYARLDNFTQGTGIVEQVRVRYYNSTYPGGTNATLEFFAINDSVRGMYLEENGHWISPALFDPLALVQVRSGIIGSISGIVQGVTDGLAGPRYSLNGLTFRSCPLLPSGDHILLVYGHDRGGNTWGEWTYLRLDTSGPADINLSVGGAYHLHGPVTLLATTTSDDCERAFFGISTDGTNFMELGTDLDGTDGWNCQLDTGLYADGTYQLGVTLRDTRGNNASSDPLVVILDNTAPVLELEAPADPYLSGSVSFRADTPDADILFCSFLLSENGSAWSEFANDTTSGNNSTGVLDTTLLADGPIRIMAVAGDLALNLNTSVIQAFVDNTDPVLTVLSPLPGSLLGPGIHTMRVSVTDANPDRVIFWGRTGSDPYTMLFTDDNGSDGYSYRIAADLLSGGTLHMRAVAWDAAGNAISRDADYLIDLGAPDLAFTSPLPGSYLSGNTQLSFDSTDELSQVMWVRVRYSGSSTGEIANITLPNGSCSIQWISGALPSGSYTIHIEAADTVGNTAAASVSVVLDNMAPIAMAGTDMSWTVGLEYRFNASISSDNIGIASYSWSFDTSGGSVVLSGISPVHTFLEAGNYTVILRVTDLAGNTATDTMVLTILRSARDNLRVSLTSPVNGTTDAPVDNDVVIVFDRALNRSTVTGAISITPAVGFDVRFTGEDSTVHLLFHDGLAYDTAYTLRIAASVSGSDTTTLATVFELSFVTEVGGTVVILTPEDGGVFEPGEAITVSGTATVVDGSLVTVSIRGVAPEFTSVEEGNWSLVIMLPQSEGTYGLNISIEGARDSNVSIVVEVGTGGSGGRSVDWTLTLVLGAIVLLLALVNLGVYLYVRSKRVDEEEEEVEEEEVDGEVDEEEEEVDEEEGDGEVDEEVDEEEEEVDGEVDEEEVDGEVDEEEVDEEEVDEEEEEVDEEEEEVDGEVDGEVDEEEVDEEEEDEEEEEVDGEVEEVRKPVRKRKKIRKRNG